MNELEAIRVARAFADAHFDAPLVIAGAHPGVERDERDRDRKIWNVVFRAEGAPDDDPSREIWVVVEVETRRAKHFQAL